MIDDLAGALFSGIGIEPLDRFGDPRVQTLSARGRDAGEQRLTHKLMSKGKRLLRPLGARDDYAHRLRFLDDIKKLVHTDLAYRSQKLKAETAPDNRCGRKCALFILVQPLQTAADNQPHVFRNVDFVDLDVRAELAGRIEHFPLLDQMPVHLLDEERISLAFLKDCVEQTLRSLALAQPT